MNAVDVVEISIEVVNYLITFFFSRYGNTEEELVVFNWIREQKDGNMPLLVLQLSHK